MSRSNLFRIFMPVMLNPDLFRLNMKLQRFDEESVGSMFVLKKILSFLTGQVCKSL